ncbi:hypothetical protein BU26DRAFT_607338 [Trematosphaeria pertusa]|uniref:Uncharacterized protein n=1 Tax=Trematosphaeria pertusa TaxID=390896 RepID=A0A6A6I962_9PLEO|nr:uncharacterized protein BU26DRAFT_607338 [Trematosphaeria pertusa]KAF2246063.1 hypothetical protein BU26DRAFT_607338 [Trematosphaeria pertusa]
MTSLTGQESSANQPDLPINPGTTTNTGGKPGKDDPSVPFKVGKESSSSGGLDVGRIDKADAATSNASGTSEQRCGEDLAFQQEAGEKGYVGPKTGSESLVESIERSVHERGEGEHSREM